MKYNYIYQGDCLEVMGTFADNSIDAIVTDPPYGIAFMGRDWDKNLPVINIWQEALRVLKPGGHILVACGTRTYHRMACNIEDAGFEIRDTVSWLYGQGFPKNHDIGKAIDKLQGNKREDLGQHPNARESLGNIQICKKNGSGRLTKGNSSYEGWGTALKPAMELWALARKPLSEPTVAKNVLKHGTGGLNIDACRVEIDKDDKNQRPNGSITFEQSKRTSMFKIGGRNPNINGNTLDMNKGRWPANVIHDGSEVITSQFPMVCSGDKLLNHNNSKSVEESKNNKYIFSKLQPNKDWMGDSGSAARFFYCAKPTPEERNAGLDGFMEKQEIGGGGITSPAAGKYGSVKAIKKNHHPTVKPIKLMQYLIKLITPKQGIVLDLFCGSGSTCLAAQRLGIKYIGIELDTEYHKIAVARCENDAPLLNLQGDE